MFQAFAYGQSQPPAAILGTAETRQTSLVRKLADDSVDRATGLFLGHNPGSDHPAGLADRFGRDEQPCHRAYKRSGSQTYD